MREELLHFIWRYRYFNQQHLFTESGVPLQILSPGEGHADQGPDFRFSRIRIGDRVLEGPVELHIRTSDWVKHAHDRDAHYRATILHVVWVNDWCGPTPPGKIPVLALEQRVPKLLLARYDQWMDRRTFVPCERQLSQVDGEVRRRWLDALAESRLQRRAVSIATCLEQNRQHWEETTWILLARSMGQPVNGAAFEAIARSLPAGLPTRLRTDRIRLEALLLGQAGLLEGPFAEDYPRRLQQEYRFLQSKWDLRPVAIPVSFLRMRPAHFPTIRLVQLAGLLTAGTGWFALLRETESTAAVVSKLQAEAGGYWVDHYVFDKQATARPKRMGVLLREGILINTFVPLLYAYGWLREEPAYREKALRWLREIRAERNVQVETWGRLGVAAEHAADTQALLELRAEYCVHRRCLSCAMGRAIFGLPAGRATVGESLS